MTPPTRGQRVKALLSRPVVWFALTLAVAAIDVLSGPYIHPGPLYLLPVGVAAWYGARLRTVFAIALVLPIVRLSLFLSDVWQPPGRALHVVLNAAVRVAALLFVAVIIDRLRRARELEREVTALRGLLPICMYCKQIQDDEGRWQSVEQYVGARSDAAFTHRVCPLCTDRHRQVFLGGR